MSADEDLGYNYMPASTPRHEFYLDDRPGDNLFGDSLVCLKAATGEPIGEVDMLGNSYGSPMT